MIISELIEILKTMPQDAMVLTKGYENGYSPIVKVEIKSVELNKEKEWWDGMYLDLENGKPVEAIFLNAETKK